MSINLYLVTSYTQNSALQKAHFALNLFCDLIEELEEVQRDFVKQS